MIEFKKTSADVYAYHGDRSLWAIITVDEPHLLLSISSDFGNWSYRWHDPGGPFKEFLVRLEKDYLIGKLSKGTTEFDVHRTVDSLKEFLKQKMDRVSPEDYERSSAFLCDRAGGADTVEELMQMMQDDPDSEILEEVFEGPDFYPVITHACYKPPGLVESFFDQIWAPLFVPKLKQELEMV